MENNNKNEQQPKKKGSLWKKVLIVSAAVAAGTGLFVLGRKVERDGVKGTLDACGDALKGMVPKREATPAPVEEQETCEEEVAEQQVEQAPVQEQKMQPRFNNNNEFRNKGDYRPQRYAN